MSEATSIPLPVLGQSSQASMSIALVGNPNAGKTTLFNSLTGLRAKTANFPGTTVDHRQATIVLDGEVHQLVDLPGAYSLEGISPEEEVTRDALMGKLGDKAIPDVIVLVLDATQLTRNLVFGSQILELGRPTIVALNMIDEAEANGLEISVDQLSEELGCEVVPIAARHGRNLDELLNKLTALVKQPVTGTCGSSAACAGCSGCQYSSRFRWATDLTRRSVQGEQTGRTYTNEKIDRIVTHRWVGLACFATLMAVVFMLIFWLASFPMDWLDGMFASTSELVGGFLPEGDFRDLITEGLIGGVGGMLVFLPQIFILFFMITLLEDSGYLARAAFVMDRLMHRVGLPGKAFVPFLAAHACAIPAIMSSRVIDDRRDRLNTILIIPLMTCSARLPVFAMVVALMFPDNAVLAGLTFAAAYAIAIIGALAISFVFRRTILPGKTKPLVIELPPYRLPSLRNALTTSLDQSRLFVRKAGTTILVFSLVLWVLATYPKATPEMLPTSWQNQLSQVEASGDTEAYDTMLAQAQSEYSIAGRMGKFIQPAFAPLGYDWRLSVGVINSFAAREVMVSTLAVLYGAGDEEEGLLGSLRQARDASGGLVFTTPTCLSLLIFYIFAMQCFPTLVVVKRELKGWKWPAFQLVYMTLVAYVGALITYQASLYFLGA
ncbi:ferrous iron transporter B [Rosistilla oblonga]|uniref:ferrous iron transporter B n=1 Tax=Rosistilla oblonga TaxID=2527990 RepID=UPI003A96C113